MLCAGCGQSIEDRVLLSVNGLLWHGDCLQCCQCRQPLTDKCFCRDDKFYCRADYLRLFVVASRAVVFICHSSSSSSLHCFTFNLKKSLFAVAFSVIPTTFHGSFAT